MTETPIIQDQSIKLIVFQKSSDLSKESSTAHGCHIESFFQGKRLQGIIHKPPSKLGYLNGISDRAEHGQGMTTCNIRAKSDEKIFFEITPYRGDAGRKIRVGLRTVGDKNSPLFHKGDLSI